ncbi:MAG: GNAT family N-acetyltransferase, partial [Ilumatobacteraceae bacterium]
RDGVDTGLVNLAGIDSKHRRCEFGIYIATPQSRSQGTGTAALSMALTYAFEELDLNKVSAEAFATNVDAIQAYERSGLRREACLRDHVTKDGKMHDVVRLAILREDWQVVRPVIEDRLRAKGLIA